MTVMTTTNQSDSVSAVAASIMPKVPVTLDTRGRVQTSKEQRRVLLEEFECSGKSAAGFAKWTGLKYSTVAGWVKHSRGRGHHLVICAVNMFVLSATTVSVA